jgi:hypothetical protein
MCGLSGVWRPKMRQKKLPLSLSFSLSHSWKKDATNHVRISICTKYITTKKKKKNPMKKSNGFLEILKINSSSSFMIIISSFKGH